jgi:pyruvate formate lyase activating enzyme
MKDSKMENTEIIGRVHSLESMGTLDGPGLRTVVFLQGCPLHCKFCHNVDSTIQTGGALYTVSELTKVLLKDKEYWKAYNPSKKRKNEIKGGVTLSGGDPVFQPQFVAALLQRLKQSKVHTALDTCLFTSTKVIDEFFPFVDLWMVSIKEMDSSRHRDLTSVPNEQILSNLRYLDQKITQSDRPVKPKIRIRFVVIPTLTDNEALLRQVGEFVAAIQNLEVLELLSYGSHGSYKWRELFGSYPLQGISDATVEDLQKAKAVLNDYLTSIKY